MKHILIVALAVLILGPARSASAESFGSTATTTEAQWGSTVIYVEPFTSPAATGTLDSMKVEVRDGGTDDAFQGVVYTSTGSAPSALVDSTVAFSATEDVQTILTANFVNGGSISASTQYYIGIINKQSANIVLHSVNASGGVGVTYKTSTTTIPASFGTPTGTDAGYEAHCVVYYTAAAAGGTARRERLLTRKR